MRTAIEDRAWGLTNLLLAVVWLGWVAALVFRYDFWAFEALNRENGAVETTSALAFLVSSLALAVVAWRRRHSGRAAIGPLALALFLFFCLGEETSWGLQVLHFQAPAAIARHNLQRETNLHNLVWVEGWATLGYRLLFFGFFVVVPLALRVWPALAGAWRRFGLGRPTFGLGVLAIVGTVLFVALGRVPFPDSPLRHWMSEIAETSTALLWLLYASRELLARRAPLLLGPVALAFATLFLLDPAVYAPRRGVDASLSRVERAADEGLVLEVGGVGVGGASRGAALRQGMLVTASSEATLLLVSSCEVRLRPASTLRLITLRGGPERSELEIELQQGALWLCATPLARDTRVRLRTPTALVETGAASLGISIEATHATRIDLGLGSAWLRVSGPGAAWPLQAGEVAVCEEGGCHGPGPGDEGLRQARQELKADWLFTARLLKREFAHHSYLLIQLESEAGLPRGSVVDRRARPGRVPPQPGEFRRYFSHAPWPGGRLSDAERESLERLLRLEAHVGALGARSGRSAPAALGSPIG
jgi:hypothetical protein